MTVSSCGGAQATCSLPVVPLQGFCSFLGQGGVPGQDEADRSNRVVAGITNEDEAELLLVMPVASGVSAACIWGSMIHYVVWTATGRQLQKWTITHV